MPTTVVIQASIKPLLPKTAENATAIAIAASMQPEILFWIGELEVLERKKGC